MPRIVAAVVLLSLATALRFALGWGREGQLPKTPIRLPLSAFPDDALGPRWTAREVQVPRDILDVARVADHLQRFYSDGERGFWLYVGYVDRWDPAAIHHPGICYPGAGLERVQDSSAEIPCPGLPMKLGFRETLWRRELGGEVYSLSAFYFRGGFSPSEEALRRSRFLGIPYFAIVTLSAEVEGSLEATRDICQEALCRAVTRLLEHFP